MSSSALRPWPLGSMTTWISSSQIRSRGWTGSDHSFPALVAFSRTLTSWQLSTLGPFCFSARCKCPRQRHPHLHSPRWNLLRNLHRIELLCPIQFCHFYQPFQRLTGFDDLRLGYPCIVTSDCCQGLHCSCPHCWAHLQVLCFHSRRAIADCGWRTFFRLRVLTLSCLWGRRWSSWPCLGSWLSCLMLFDRYFLIIKCE